MKKKNLFGISLLLVLLSSAAYGRGPTVYDKKVPLEESCTLRIFNCFVTEFDGKRTGSAWWSEMGTKEMIIPAGNHTLQIHTKNGGLGNFDGNFGFIETFRTGDFSRDFQAGRTYLVSGGSSGNGLVVDVTLSQEDPVPDPSSPNATPFEGEWHCASRGWMLTFCGNEYILNRGSKGRDRGRFGYNDTEVILFPFVFYNAQGKMRNVDYFLPIHIKYSGEVITQGKDQYAKVTK
jgi:hypothetical protein